MKEHDDIRNALIGRQHKNISVCVFGFASNGGVGTLSSTPNEFILGRIRSGIHDSYRL